MEMEKNLKSIKDILNYDIQTNGIIFSPIFGDLEYLGEDNGLKFRSLKSNNIVIFREDGKYAEGGDVLLFPSKDNKNWENVPIIYPKTKEELLDMYCKRRNVPLSKLETTKKLNLYFYLRSLARFLDSLAVNLKWGPFNVWIVYPVWDETATFLTLKWEVKKRTEHFFHFGFCTKTAAKKFLEFMEEEINEWVQNVYQFQYEDPNSSNLSFFKL